MKTTIVSGVLVATLALGVSGCNQPQPTASEIFHLRGECEQLGQKISDEAAKNLPSSETHANYLLKNNRCYVTQTHFPIENDPKENYLFIWMEDGQSGDVLAATRIDYTTGKKVAWFFLPTTKKPDDKADYGFVQEFIERCMKREGEQP
jgi:hypothetical protein